MTEAALAMLAGQSDRDNIRSLLLRLVGRRRMATGVLVARLGELHVAMRVARDLVMSLLFRVPCPTPDGQTARDLYEKRVRRITDDMRADAREHGCRYHRAWYAQDGHAFYAIAISETSERAATFYKKWNIADEPGEETISLEGDIGLAPEPPPP